jgi:hypothetical protein
MCLNIFDCKENTCTPHGDPLRVWLWQVLFKLLLKRDEQPVRLFTIQAEPVVCEIGRLVIITEKINAAIAHYEKGVLP